MKSKDKFLVFVILFLLSAIVTPTIVLTAPLLPPTATNTSKHDVG